MNRRTNLSASATSRMFSSAFGLLFLVTGCTTTSNDTGRDTMAPVGHRSIKDSAEPVNPVRVASKPAIPAAAKAGVRLAPAPSTALPAKSPVYIPNAGCGNTQACIAEPKVLLDNSSRYSIGAAATPDTYARGTRPFALRVMRPSLECTELTEALTQLAQADKIFEQQPVSVEAAQGETVRSLIGQVERELKVELASRC